ncbi:universal stress protein [Thiocapsa rosea]|uniref:universal stress protein n=1 Tax=Thiocapsa rosea TaxID=69360 RepID=UPI0024831C5D|nr:universal stress protein [Thiocapsa rosea]
MEQFGDLFRLLGVLRPQPRQLGIFAVGAVGCRWRLRHVANLPPQGVVWQANLNSYKPKTHLVRGDARRKIPTLARKIGADVVVMGTVGRGGIPGLLMGNMAEAILQQVDCSVLATKPPGFVTSVALDG